MIGIVLSSSIAGLLIAAAPVEQGVLVDIAEQWQKRRDRYQSLSGELAGTRLIPAGEFNEAEGLPPDTKPPIPAKDHRSLYKYNCLIDFKKQRLRIEKRYDIFVPMTTSFYEAVLIRAWDGQANRSILPVSSSAPTVRKLIDNKPGKLGSIEDIPMLLPCGYTPPMEMPRDSRHLLHWYAPATMTFSEIGKPTERSKMILLSAPQLGSLDTYDEYLVEPEEGYRIIEWRRHMGGHLVYSAEIVYEGNWRNDKPTAITFIAYRVNTKLAETLRLKVSKWKINAPFRAEEFTLKPTTGMTVTDGVTGERYVYEGE
jgi:hypothetical protein